MPAFRMHTVVIAAVLGLACGASHAKTSQMRGFMGVWPGMETKTATETVFLSQEISCARDLSSGTISHHVCEPADKRFKVDLASNGGVVHSMSIRWAERDIGGPQHAWRKLSSVSGRAAMLCLVEDFAHAGYLLAAVRLQPIDVFAARVGLYEACDLVQVVATCGVARTKIEGTA